MTCPVSSQPTTKQTEYKKIINRRKLHCVSVIHEIIKSSPSEMRNLIKAYETLEEIWKMEDELNGFNFQDFKNQNNDFVNVLKSICNNVEFKLKK